MDPVTTPAGGSPSPAGPTSTPTPSPSPSPASAPSTPAPSSTAKKLFDDVDPKTTPPTPSTPAPGLTSPEVPKSPTPTIEPQPTEVTPSPASAPFQGDLKKTLVEAVREGLRPAADPNAPPPQMSEEEFNKTFNVRNVTQEDMDMLAQGGEVATKKMGEIVQGVAKQAITMASFMMKHQMEGLMKELAPYRQFADNLRETQFKSSFFEAHPDLKDFEPILQEVTAKLQREGLKGSQAEVFKKISDEARKFIAAAKGSTGPVVTPDGQHIQPKTNSMPTLSGGGQGGAGGAGASSKQGGNSTAKRIFS